jgi:uncharacterized protein (DUF433 family)
MDYRDYITVEPGKRGGKPCVRGLRITVDEVLGYLSAMTEAEVLEDFPYLTPDDFRACRAFAAERERLTFNAAKLHEASLRPDAFQPPTPSPR